VFTHQSNDVLRDVTRRDAVARCSMHEHLNRFGHAKPGLAVLKPESGHGVVANAGGENAEGAVNRRVRVAADNDLTGRPEAVLDDDVVEAAAPAIEEIPNAVFGCKLADRVE